MANLASRPNWRGRVANNNGNNFYQVNLGLKTHAGVILGGGTSADPVLSATASAKFASFYTANSATSGESYALYWKHSVTGAGGSATIARFYAYTNVTASTVQAAQISTSLGAAGMVSGLCTGVRSQLMFADDKTAAFTTGTYCGGQTELYFEGDNSSTTDISGAPSHCIHRFIVDGDTTARAKVRNLFEICNISTGTSDVTKMLNTANITASHGLNVIINGEAYSLLVDKK
jgi:hypothetical protein